MAPMPPMRNAIVRSVLILLTACPLVGPGAAFAYLTDAASHTPVNYAIFLPPGVGGGSIDPVFGTAVKRISDSLNTPNAADTGNLAMIVNEYSTMSPFNSDNSKLLLQHQSYFALYDGTGVYIRDLPFEISASSEPRWSRTDPNVFYYHPNTNQLKQYNVATGVSSVVHTFLEYTTIGGRGESDISLDGDHFVLVGDNRDIFVYRISTDTKGPTLDTGGRAFDSVYITPNNNVIVNWIQAGSNPYSGVELYDSNMTFLRQLSQVEGHMAVTRDTNGDEVMLWINAADPLASCPNSVVKIRLADGQKTCLVSLAWGLGAHLSAPASGGWFFVSTYAPSDPSPLSGWPTYTNEIFQVTLDGSQVRRLAHHRSRPFNSYWYTPRAAASRDGSRLVYSSNYGLQAILGYSSGYSDVYLISLASSAPAIAGSQIPVTTRIEQNNVAVKYGGSWYTNTYPLHSGGSAALAMDSGASATLTFSGTGVRWIGYRDQWSGIALVYVDGQLKTTVDTFAASAQSQAVLFATNGLSPGSHSLTIQPAGAHNQTSGGSWVWIDAFDVVTRFEQSDSAVRYTCPPYVTWYTNTLSLHSGGSAALAMSDGCQAGFTFTGTAVSWIGYRDEWAGIARVYIDGALRAEIDTYASPYLAQAVIYTLSGLPLGMHTLTIEATGQKNSASGGAWIWVDAFETPP